MKKWLSSILCLGVSVTLPFFASHAKAADNELGSVLLHVGSSGSPVVTLQKDLRTLGYFTYPTDTGYYGEVTANSVIHFQQDHGLQANGMVGLSTGPAITNAVESVMGQKVVSTGLMYQGVPYVWGGSTPSGFDCSGFVQYVFQKYGFSLPRTASLMYEQGMPVSQNELMPGDLVFFSTYHSGASHVGIYEGNGDFISATLSRGVTVSSLSNPYWNQRYVGAKRVL